MARKPVFYNRDGVISTNRQNTPLIDILNRNNRNIFGREILPTSNPVTDGLNQAGESVSKWFNNNGVNVFFVIIGLLMVLTFVISFSA